MTAPQLSARYPATICRRGKGLTSTKVLHPLRRIPFRLQRRGNGCTASPAALSMIST